MAFEITKLFGGPSNLLITIANANATANEDITGTGDATNTLYIVEVDCKENPGEDVYVRFWDVAAAGSPNVGTTDARVLVPGFRGEVHTMSWHLGIIWASAISTATVTNQGATSGATDPTGIVRVRIWCKDGIVTP